MKILLVEPFWEGSHQSWAEGWCQASRHQLSYLHLPGRHWKWRMYGGAVSLAQKFMQLPEPPDLILASDMLDLTTFLSLTRQRSTGIPTALYFHENQITYPWSPSDPDVPLRRDNQYGFLNYTSALAADALFFNSQYHLDSFIGALPDFLRQFPDHRELELVEGIRQKSQVLYLGMDLRAHDPGVNQSPGTPPIILWNHRWEYDKQPEPFFNCLFQLAAEGLDFQLVVLGNAYRQQPAIFERARRELADRILHFGFVADRASYRQWLWRSDILPVTAIQDFFGGSVVEAIYTKNYPLLPDRLAYPEHLPTQWRATHLYADEADLKQRLTVLLRDWPRIPAWEKASAALQNFVSRYDWVNLAGRYDTSFEKMMYL
ncbi:MAG: DUF3524 domain-containing protein [Bacteroidota bacterium]